MKITEQQVRYVADLANLSLTDDEIGRMVHDLDEILTHVDKLAELDTSNVEPMAQVVPAAASGQGAAVGTPLREDKLTPCDVAREVLAGAPDPSPPYFRVPRVIER